MSAPMEILWDGWLSLFSSGRTFIRTIGPQALAALVSCYLRTTWSLPPGCRCGRARFPPGDRWPLLGR